MIEQCEVPGCRPRGRTAIAVCQIMCTREHLLETLVCAECAERFPYWFDGKPWCGLCAFAQRDVDAAHRLPPGEVHVRLVPVAKSMTKRRI